MEQPSKERLLKTCASAYVLKKNWKMTKELLQRIPNQKSLKLCMILVKVKKNLNKFKI